MKYVVGNWKMHSTAAEGKALAEGLIASAKKAAHACVVICPPATLLMAAGDWLKSTEIQLGAQDCHTESKGAFTGDISAPMLKDAGCGYVIVGHSERRQYHGETNTMVCRKAEAALAAGILPIICIGETLEDRDAGRTNDVLAEQAEASLPQVANSEVIIAYEPVWAIGTGRTPSLADIEDAHLALLAFVKRERKLEQGRLSVLYGGSVKPDNAKDILALPSVGGVLVGGASLNAFDFSAIIAAVE